MLAVNIAAALMLMLCAVRLDIKQVRRGRSYVELTRASLIVDAITLIADRANLLRSGGVSKTTGQNTSALIGALAGADVAGAFGCASEIIAPKK